MSRKFFGLLALSGMVLMLAGFSTQSKEAEAGFLFFSGGHGCGACGCASYDDDDCGHDDDDCCAPACGCAPVCCAPAPVTCCAPAPTCCAPAPSCCAPVATCCGAASSSMIYEDGGSSDAAPAPPAEEAPAPAAEEAPAPKTDA